MSAVGKVASLWRYPVKSMAGEELEQAFVGFSGLYGDRVYGFTSPHQPDVFPYHTARTSTEMLLYRPRFRYPDRMLGPPLWDQIKDRAAGLTPLYGSADDMAVIVTTPRGDTLAIDDPGLKQRLGTAHNLALQYSQRALTDCRPLSLISLQTLRQLEKELEMRLDLRRFRANIYLDLDAADGFGEDGFVGKTLRLGEQLQVSVLERDPRCQMIALDPDTGERNREILKHVSRVHENMAGVYGAVLGEGVVRPGDPIEVI